MCKKNWKILPFTTISILIIIYINKIYMRRKFNMQIAVILGAIYTHNIFKESEKYR